MGRGLASSRPPRPRSGDLGCAGACLVFLVLGASVAGLPLAYFWPRIGFSAFAFGLAGLMWGVFAMRRHDRAWSEYAPALKAWYQHVTPFGYDAWRRLVEAEGLGDRIPEFEKDLTVAFRAEPVAAGPSDVRSRLGGVPEVPVDFVWPHSGSNPWKFFGQVALAELPDAQHDLPREGTLSLFNQESFGHDARTFFFPADVPLVLRTPPADAETSAPMPVKFWAYQEIPDVPGCDAATIAEIREYLAGDLLALHGRDESSSVVLWQAIDGYGHRTLAFVEPADLRDQDFSRVVHMSRPS